MKIYYLFVILRAVILATLYNSFMANAEIAAWYIQTISDTGGSGVTVDSSG